MCLVFLRPLRTLVDMGRTTFKIVNSPSQDFNQHFQSLLKSNPAYQNQDVDSWGDHIDESAVVMEDNSPVLIIQFQENHDAIKVHHILSPGDNERYFQHFRTAIAMIGQRFEGKHFVFHLNPADQRVLSFLHKMGIPVIGDSIAWMHNTFVRTKLVENSAEITQIMDTLNSASHRPQCDHT